MNSPPARQNYSTPLRPPSSATPPNMVAPPSPAAEAYTPYQTEKKKKKKRRWLWILRMSQRVLLNDSASAMNRSARCHSFSTWHGAMSVRRSCLTLDILLRGGFLFVRCRYFCCFSKYPRLYTLFNYIFSLQ